MQASFPSILIVYNPVSTSGKAEARANRLAEQLVRKGIKKVRVVQSEYPGHSEELAFHESIDHKKPLIISVSGDGGYNSVVNGAIRAQLSNTSIKPVCAILAAGNANDHRRAVAKRPLIKAILDYKPESMDILEFRFGATTRYAHSYIGIGTTADIAAELSKTELTRWKEIKIVTRNLIAWRDFAIRTNQRNRQIDSLVFANIHRMAKVLKLNAKTDLQNGLFTLVLIPHRTRFKFLFLVSWIALFGVKDMPELREYNFQLIKPQLAQLDGEPLAVPAMTNIRVSVRPSMLSILR